MVLAYIGLGSNLDDPQTHVSRAFSELESLPDSTLVKHSSLYKTTPVGPQNQADFINAVSLVNTTLQPIALLKQMQEIENRHGRVRTGEQWGPRTLDLDLLLYGDSVIHETGLIVPHPELHRRCFVLQPLYELSEQLMIPGIGSVTDLLQQIDCKGVRKLSDA